MKINTTGTGPNYDDYRNEPKKVEIPHLDELNESLKNNWYRRMPISEIEELHDIYKKNDGMTLDELKALLEGYDFSEKDMKEILNDLVARAEFDKNFPPLPRPFET